MIQLDKEQLVYKLQEKEQEIVIVKCVLLN